MNGLPGLKNRGRVLAGGLLLAAVATPAVVTAAVAAAPAAHAAPATAMAPIAVAAPPAVTAPGTTKAPGTGGPPGAVTWSAVGATPKGTNGRYEFSYNNIKPGTVIEDWVELFNRGTGSAAFQVYGADAVGTTLGNSITYDEVGVQPKRASASGRPSIIPPPSRTLRRPPSSCPAGTASSSHSPSPSRGPRRQVTTRVASWSRSECRGSTPVGQHVTVYSRIALPILLRVVGPLRTGLQIESVSTGFSVPLNPFGTGSATISYSVTNTGNLRLSGAQLVKVSGPFGSSAAVPVHFPSHLAG